MQGDILQNINIVLEKIYKSIEGKIYDILDRLLIISPDIMKQEPIKNIMEPDKKGSIIIIATSLLLFYTITYIILKLISMYTRKSTREYI
ncbi:MAG: hypothetical protein PHD20_01325 [Clostridia bacterium]|nr:hypothetical protein [Clostridia bacterium]